MKPTLRVLVWMTAFLITIVSLESLSFAREYEYAGTYAVPEFQDGFSGEQYDMRAGKKLERGLKNLFLGWLEIPQGVKSEIGFRRHEYLPVGIETFFIGLFKGTSKTVGRMTIGLYEVFTFPYAQGPVIQEMDEWLY